MCVDTACTLGICAERNAIFHMITNGENAIRRVIAINHAGKALPPCGACREFMTQLMPDSYRTKTITNTTNGRILAYNEKLRANKDPNAE